MSATGMQTWLGVYMERRDIAGEEVWAVTISRSGRDTTRRLFADHASAGAYALEQADWHDLPLFDLAEVPAE